MIREVLIRGAEVVVTMDGARRELAGADVLIRDGVIAAVGPGLVSAGEVVLARGCVVTPGLVNTHHHLYQTLTRAVPGGQDALLFGWLKTLYPIWARMGPEEIRVSALIGLAELALTGCTLSSDHLYLYPNGARLEDTIHAAGEIGLRFQRWSRKFGPAFKVDRMTQETIQNDEEKEPFGGVQSEGCA